jgi:hypothetical protein
MQAYNIKGKMDLAGNLVITEPVKLPPGEVEMIVLQPILTLENASFFKTDEVQAGSALAGRSTLDLHSEAFKKNLKSKVKSLRKLLENAPPVPPDFDPEEARWEALKEKYNL